MAKRFGNYLLHECVAQGGITEIWMATDEFENVVAIRKLRNRGLSTSGSKLFKAGLKVHRKLSPHPNVIRFINHGKTDGTLFMVLQYIHGTDLKALLARKHDIVDNVADVLIQMADGLNHLHDRGWIHLDYKPENIMVGDRPNMRDHVKVVDFGIAKVADTGHELASIQSIGGLFCGTPEYMSPEQATGADVDRRSDLYSLGVILYQLLVGEVPFQDPTALGVITKHLSETPIAPQERQPEIQPELSALAMRRISGFCALAIFA